ncbi:MAG: response regulator [Verrucomicrobiota bacterium]
MADDLEYNLAIGRELFQKLGAEIVEACDGQQALEKLIEHDFEFALIDMSMPKKNGLEVARAYRQHKPGSETKLAALSAHTMGEVEQKCLDAGFDRFISKPLNPTKVAAALGFEIDYQQNVFTQDLLNYIADEDPAKKRSLLKRHADSLFSEVSDLGQSIESNDAEEIRNQLHKISGLLQIHPSKELTKVFGVLNEDAKAGKDKETLLSHCNAIELLIRSRFF